MLAALVDAGLKEAVTPVGNPSAVKATSPANPPRGDTETATVPLPPEATLRLAGEADSATSRAPEASTVSVTDAVCARPPP